MLVNYMVETKTLEFCLRPHDDTHGAYVDASYASHPDGKSHGGYVCMYGGAVVMARSAKGVIVSKSSTEAELLALNDCVDEVRLERHLLQEVERAGRGPTTIREDNKSTIVMAERGELGTKRTKHYTVRHYYVTEQIVNGTVKLEHVSGTKNIADGLTKPYKGATLRGWSKVMLGGDLAAQEGMLEDFNKPKCELQQEKKPGLRSRKHGRRKMCVGGC